MEDLGIFDQLPFFRTYSEVVLLFPIPADVELSNVIATLENASDILKKNFPSLSGQVVLEGNDKDPAGNSGYVRLKPYHEEPTLRVEDLSGSLPSYDKIRAAKAPASLLDGNILAPMKALPDRYDGSETTPVFIVQANFIDGGLILCFAGMHSFMDATGVGQIIRLFAMICRGQEIPAGAIAAGTLDRKGIIPSLPPDQPGLEHLELRRSIDQIKAASTAERPFAPWIYFRLRNQALATLKAEAIKQCLEDKFVSWVSSNDVACALIWRAVMKARSPRLKKDDQVAFLRAVNGRRFLTPPIPEGYFGNVVVGAATVELLQDLIDGLSIPTITIRIRQSLQSITDFSIRSVASMIQSEPNKRTITFDPSAPEKDLVISSWASLPLYTSDFGPLLGNPEFVRRPHFSSCDGLVYIMPTTPDGHLDVAVSLREEDMERLKADEQWKDVAELLG